MGNMRTPTSSHEALRTLAVMAGVLEYCPKHQTFYRGSNGPELAMPYYDRHIDAMRAFFGSPVAFYTALKHERAKTTLTYCPACTRAVGLV
jgi:hypothetical protein